MQQPTIEQPTIQQPTIEQPTAQQEASGPRRISFGRLLVVGTKAYGINLLLLIGLHPLVPIAILVPMATGFATGWQIEATWMQGAAIGLIMGVWMALVCSIGVAAAVIASLLYPGGLESGAELGIAAIVGLLVMHLTTFGGIGAILGGHFARKERRTKEASAAKAGAAHE